MFANLEHEPITDATGFSEITPSIPDTRPLTVQDTEHTDQMEYLLTNAPKPGANPVTEFLAKFGYTPGVPFSDDEDTWRYCPACFSLQLRHPDNPYLWSICSCLP